MLEFRQPLLQREVVPEPDAVVRGGFNWLVELDKDYFIGRDALIAAHRQPAAVLPVCFVSDAPVLAPGDMIGSSGEALGRIVHAVRSPEDEQWRGVAHVERTCAASGLVFTVTGTPHTVRTVSAPIRVPTSWGGLLDQPVDV